MESPAFSLKPLNELNRDVTPTMRTDPLACPIATILHMEIRFKPTEEDGLNAMRATSMPSWGMFLFVLLLALLFLVSIYLINHDLPVAGWLWLALSAVIGIAVYEVPRIQVSRSLRKSPSAQGEIVIVLDGEGTVTTFPRANCV